MTPNWFLSKVVVFFALPFKYGICTHTNTQSLRIMVYVCVCVLGKLTKIVFIGAANARHTIIIIQLRLQTKRE